MSDRSSPDIVEVLRVWRKKMPANWYGNVRLDTAISEILGLRASLQPATPTAGEPAVALTEGQHDTLARIANARASGIELNQFWLDLETKWLGSPAAGTGGDAVAGDVQAARSSEPHWQARPPHSDWRRIAPEFVDDYRAKDWEVRFTGAAQPSEQQRIDDAKRITSAVLNTMTNGGDNLAIYEAVWGSLSSTDRPAYADPDFKYNEATGSYHRVADRGGK